MGVSISIAPASEKLLLHRMIELYQHDFSEFTGDDLNEEGYFGYPYLETFWTEDDRVPFIARVKGRLAGFALVHTYTYWPANQYVMAEFFILKKYRRQGIGRQVATYVFDQFPGRWEVDQLLNNIPAQHFWRKVIHDYTNGHFTETQTEFEGRLRVVQCFDSTGL